MMDWESRDGRRGGGRGRGAGEGSVMCEIFGSHTVSAISRSAARRHRGAWVGCAHVAPTIYGILFVTRAHTRPPGAHHRLPLPPATPSLPLLPPPRPRLIFVRCVWPSILLWPAPSRPTAEIASAFSEQYIRRNTGGYPLTDHYCYL
jgi:hypothetical protein